MIWLFSQLRKMIKTEKPFKTNGIMKGDQIKIPHLGFGVHPCLTRTRLVVNVQLCSCLIGADTVLVFTSLLHLCSWVNNPEAPL